MINMVIRKSISKEEYDEFINHVCYLEYHFSEYLREGRFDDYIEKNKKEIQYFIDTDQFTKIEQRAKKKRFSSDITLSATDYQILRKSIDYNARLEVILNGYYIT